MATPRRELNFLLAEHERRLLVAIAKRLPRWVTPDHLTALGALGAVGTAVGYAASNRGAAWLWLANAMLVMVWFGDSLDGTVARIRKAERPRYGHYVDHLMDAFATVVIGVGMGLSPYIEMNVALALVVAYLVLSVNSHLEALAFDVFRLDYGKLGPTEVRLTLIVVNTVLVLVTPTTSREWTTLRLVLDSALLVIVAAMLGAVVVRGAHNVRRLFLLEPRRPDANHD
jgi:phosphatidylglycerophosphate synthase